MMDSVRGLVERDCGGANSLMKLAAHATKVNEVKQIGSHRQVQHDEFADEFLSEGHRLQMAPNTFSMDSLLQEMKLIDNNTTRNKSIEYGSDLVTSANHWVHQFTGDDMPLVDSNEWTSEYLHDYDDNLLAREYLELADAQQRSRHQDVDNGFKWMEQLEETDVLADTARELLTAVNDPKLAGTQFMQFMKQISDGQVKVKDNEVIIKNDVDITSKVDNSWTDEYLLRTRDLEKSWTDEFTTDRAMLGDTIEKGSFDDYYSQIDTDLLADKWVEEFSNELSSAVSSNTETHDNFWETLQSHWDELAKQDENSGLGWLSEFDKFDADSYYKDYKFHEDNSLVDHQNPFGAGVERLKVGDIPGAVLLFEAAVQKNPQHAEAWQYLGTTLADNEQEPEAIAALRKCLDLERGNLTALLSLAVSFTNESLMQRACETLHSWLQRHPRYCHLVTNNDVTSEPQRPQISSFVSSDYHNSIKELFMRAVQTSSEIDADLQVGLGVLFHLTSEYDKAVDCFNTALQLRPKDSLLWNKLGATLANASRNEEAVNAYRQALLFSPGYIRTRYNLGVACVNLGVYREAMDHFLSALDVQQNSSSNILAGSRRSVMSDNLWSAVDTTLTLLGRTDLQTALHGREVDTLLNVFSKDSQRDSMLHEPSQK